MTALSFHQKSGLVRFRPQRYPQLLGTQFALHENRDSDRGLHVKRELTIP